MERGIEDFTEDKKRWEKGLKVERNEEREEASTPLSKAELKSAGEREDRKFRRTCSLDRLWIQGEPCSLFSN